MPTNPGIHRLNVYVQDDLGNWNFQFFEFVTEGTVQTSSDQSSSSDSSSTSYQDSDTTSDSEIIPVTSPGFEILIFLIGIMIYKLKLNRKKP